MTKLLKYISISLVTILSGCSHDRLPESVNDSIVFSGNATDTQEITRVGADLITTNAELRSRSFGIFGSRSTDNINFNTLVFETDAAKEVSFSGTEWTYSPKQKWVRSNWYRFRAFWPYEARISPGSDANLMVIDYSAITDNYDLQVAYKERYPIAEGVGRVPMVFKHTLAALCFKVRFDEPLTDAITGFYLKGLKPTGTLVCGIDGTNENIDDFRWISNTFDDTSEIQEWTGNKEFSMSAATIYDGDGVIYVIPQQASSMKGATTINFFTQNGGSALHTAPIQSEFWQPGKVYTYTIIIHESDIRLEVDIKDWTMLDSNFDINL